MDWHGRAQRVIAKVVQENPSASDRELQKLIREAYPWGERKHWPYKAWLAAVKDIMRWRESLVGRDRIKLLAQAQPVRDKE